MSKNEHAGGQYKKRNRIGRKRLPLTLSTALPRRSIQKIPISLVLTCLITRHDALIRLCIHFE